VLKVVAFTLSSFGNRLKQHFKIQEAPKGFIIIWMVIIFLAGILDYFFDGESLAYNIGQGFFISFFSGSVLVVYNILIRRRKR
jgi:hypothetical protein